MFKKINLRIEQIQLSLRDLENSDLSTVAPERTETAGGISWRVDPGKSITEAELANAASQLLANIASIKDLLKHYCKENNKNFEGEALIDSNLEVGLVHDLWNLDKHGRLTTPSRSKQNPVLKNLSQVIRIAAGTGNNSSASFGVDPHTGQFVTHTQNGGKIALMIIGDVINDQGRRLGDFTEICEKALIAWEQVLKRAGILIPD